MDVAHKDEYSISLERLRHSQAIVIINWYNHVSLIVVD